MYWYIKINTCKYVLNIFPLIQGIEWPRLPLESPGPCLEDPLPLTVRITAQDPDRARMEAPLDPHTAVHMAHTLRDPTHPLTAAQGALGMW